jgi:transcriptional regulator with XRE-family HTH domain
MADRGTVGANIRRYRIARGLSQPQLAHQIPMSERWLGEVEAGRIDPKLTDALRLADVLSLSLDELVRDGPSVDHPTRPIPVNLRRLTPRQISRIEQIGTRWGTWLGSVWFPWVVAGFGPYAADDIESYFHETEDPYPHDLETVFREIVQDINEREAKGEEVPYDGEDYKLTQFAVSSRRGRNEAPRLILHFSPTTYYRMLATDQRLDVPITVGGRTYTPRERYAADVNLRVSPVAELATHWGVGLAVITSDNKLLVSERGNTAVDPHVYFPAVAEGATTAMDAAPNGAPDHFKVASRGVLEELGVPLSPDELIWLSFGANSYLCEYGLIGRVDSPYSYDQIERRRAVGAARDSWETRRLHAVDFSPTEVAHFCANPERGLFEFLRPVKLPPPIR